MKNHLRHLPLLLAGAALGTSSLLLLQNLPESTISSAEAAGGVVTDPNAAAPDRYVYYPGTEELAKDEIRVIACGTGLPAARRGQAATCFLIEAGNGEKFLFDIKWFVEYGMGVDLAIHESFEAPQQLVDFYNQPPQLAWRACCELHTSPEAFGKIMSTIEPRHAVAFHFSGDGYG